MGRFNLLPRDTGLNSRWKQLYAAAILDSTILNCPTGSPRHGLPCAKEPIRQPFHQTRNAPSMTDFMSRGYLRK